MDTLLSMKVFRQVVESGSFVAAAERLSLSTAMTSAYVVRSNPVPLKGKHQKRLGTGAGVVCRTTWKVSMLHF